MRFVIRCLGLDLLDVELTTDQAETGDEDCGELSGRATSGGYGALDTEPLTPSLGYEARR